MRRKDRAVTDPGELREILEKCRVLRLGIQDPAGTPYIVPLNFGYELAPDGQLTLYMHCARAGRKLELIRQQPLVGFEMDCDHALSGEQSACSYTFKYASIIGSGRAVVLTDPPAVRLGLSRLMEHYTGRAYEDFPQSAGMEQAVAVIRLVVREYTGKRNQ